jgi:hypothetical protein
VPYGKMREFMTIIVLRNNSDVMGVRRLCGEE